VDELEISDDKPFVLDGFVWRISERNPLSSSSRSGAEHLVCGQVSD
jgi:hypothetical protein